VQSIGLIGGGLRRRSHACKGSTRKRGQR
jgi:hypothetical protein